MQEVNESCFGAIENTSDITGVSIIKVNVEPYTVILFKLGMVMREGKKKNMVVKREMHREITVNICQSLLVFLIISCIVKPHFVSR
jgi:predicted cupin superfamily sugar epimerase